MVALVVGVDWRCQMHRRKALEIFSSFLALCSSPSLLSANTLKQGVKVGYLSISDHLLIIAKEFSKSVNIVPLKFSSWSEISEALRAGAIDGAFLLAPLGLMLRANGVDIKAVLSSHKNGSALVARSQIGGVNELNDKIIAVPSKFSIHFYLVDKIINENKIKAKIVELPPPEMPSALLSGAIDAFCVAEPFGQIAVNTKRAKNLLFSKDVLPNHICCLLNFNSQILNEPFYDDLLNAFKNAANFLTTNPSEAINLASKIISQKSSILSDIVSKNIVSYSDLSLKLQDLENLREFLISKNLGNQKLKSLNISEYLAL